MAETMRLKVVLLPYLSFAPIFIAAEEGYFAEQELHVDFIKISKSDQAIPALSQGGLDVLGAAISVGILNAMARGGEIRIVADRGHLEAEKCDFTALLARRELVASGHLQEPAQLRGRSVAITRTSFEAFYLDRFLKAAYLTTEDVRVIDVPTAVLSHAFANSAIDCAIVAEPWITRLQRAGEAVIWQSLKQTLGDFQISFILYGPNLLSKNPEAGRRFMIAYLRRVRQYNLGKTDRNLEICAQHTGEDRDLLRKACWPALRNNGQIDPQSILAFQAWALEKKLMDTAVAASQFWDPRFVEQAERELERKP